MATACVRTASAYARAAGLVAIAQSAAARLLDAGRTARAIYARSSACVRMGGVAATALIPSARACLSNAAGQVIQTSKHAIIRQHVFSSTPHSTRTLTPPFSPSLSPSRVYRSRPVHQRNVLLPFEHLRAGLHEPGLS